MDGHKPEVSEKKLFNYLKEHKVVTERKQLDELIRQCSYTGYELPSPILDGQPISKSKFIQLFTKPFFMIGFENLIELAECQQPRESGILRVIGMHRAFLNQLFDLN